MGHHGMGDKRRIQVARFILPHGSRLSCQQTRSPGNLEYVYLQFDKIQAMLATVSSSLMYAVVVLCCGVECEPHAISEGCPISFFEENKNKLTLKLLGKFGCEFGVHSALVAVLVVILFVDRKVWTTFQK
jgi:hypothetical protein